ncbi:MAG: hypothetical protein ACQEQO_00225 [Thermodesulfobacteriota bacterium]
MRLVTLVHNISRVGSQFGLEIICGEGGKGITAYPKGRDLDWNQTHSRALCIDFTLDFVARV